jgi:hypothetical protein
MCVFKFFKKQKSTIDITNKKDKALNNNGKDLPFSKNRSRFTPEYINVLSSNEVFVFGSNLEGRHGGGAARTALNKFGAINGQGAGLQGQSYGIPTMHGGGDVIAPYVDEFIAFATGHPEKLFYVTRIGCGIAGFKDKEIAPLFKKALNLDNVCLPETFVLALKKQPKKEKINKPITIKLTKSLLDSVLIKEIIYAEVAGGGAMGNAGGIILYLIKDEQLICYETHLYTDEKVYLLAEKLLIKHQDKFKYDDINKGVKLFNYFYGGMGNNVFVNKNVTLEINEGYFIYNKDGVKYQILSSVQGVFDGVVYAMKHPEKENLF